MINIFFGFDRIDSSNVFRNSDCIFSWTEHTDMFNGFSTSVQCTVSSLTVFMHCQYSSVSKLYSLLNQLEQMKRNNSLK